MWGFHKLSDTDARHFDYKNNIPVKTKIQFFWMYTNTILSNQYKIM